MIFFRSDLKKIVKWDLSKQAKLFK